MTSNNDFNLVEFIKTNFPRKKSTERNLIYSFSFSNSKDINKNISYIRQNIYNDYVKEKKLGQFIFEKKIGQGTFGKVMLAKDEITGEQVAIKILDKEKILREINKSKLEREIKILKILRHNNIVHLYNVVDTRIYLYLIMEYIQGIELFEYINYKHYLSEFESCNFFQQIISGIEYLGKIKVVHRDLKPENLLITNNGTIKIVDFGLSNTYFTEKYLTTACGSPCYAAPEMIKGKKYLGLGVDIWSSGVVLYAMLCGSLPFEDTDNERLYRKITEGKFETPDFLSNNANDFLHRILNVDPVKRYTIDQIKNHPWFNLINPKLNMSEGLLIKSIVVPIDEKIVFIMVNKYKFKEDEIKINLLSNEHNQITTTYYLLLKKFIKARQKTVGDMTSPLFEQYIKDYKNELSYYNNDIELVINERVYGKKVILKKRENRKQRKISERKCIKKNYLIDTDTIKSSNRGDSAIITKHIRFDNNERSPSIKIAKYALTCMENSNKQFRNKLKKEMDIWKKIYFKKLYNTRKNSNNKLSFSFYKNNKLLRNRILRKENFSLHRSDKYINMLSAHISKSKSKNNKNNKNRILNNFPNFRINDFDNNINIINNYQNIGIKNQRNIKNTKLQDIHKISFNKKLYSMTNSFNYKTNKNNNIIPDKKMMKFRTNSEFKQFINNTSRKNNSISAKSMIYKYQNSISSLTPLKYNQIKLFSNRNNKLKILHSKDKKNENKENINSNQYKIKVDKKILTHKSSNNSYIKDKNFSRNNKNIFFSDNNYNKNERKIKYSNEANKINTRIISEKNEKSINYNNLKSLNIINFDDSKKEIIKIHENRKSIKYNYNYSNENKLNLKEYKNIYKRIKIQKSPFNKLSFNEKTCFRKRFLLRNKIANSRHVSHCFKKQFFDTSVQFHKKNDISISMKNSGNIGKNMEDSIDKTINIKELEFYKKNKSIKQINKADKFLKINTIDNISTFEDEQNQKNKNQNMNIKKNINEYFKRNIRRKKIFVNNTSLRKANTNIINLTKTSFNYKNNAFALNNNISNITENKYINTIYSKNRKDLNNKNKIVKNTNNENHIYKPPQLCITNINFYNYVNDANPSQKLIQKNNNNLNTNPNYKNDFIQKIETNNNIPKDENKLIKNDKKFDASKNKNFIPFDLNSILSLNKTNSIKNCLIKEFNFRKIQYKINQGNSGFNMAFICYKNDLRFDLNVNIYEENYNKKFYLIKAKRKQGNVYKYKSLLNQIINKIK